VRLGSPTSAAIYARISHDPSGERLGVQRQEADCLEEAKRRGWSIAQVYVDDDLSAYNTKKPRPQYQRLLNDIQLGRRDGVMIWRLDRLHRQPRELEEFIVLCDKHRVALATVTGDVDLATSQGRLLARAWGAFAAHESEIRGERLSRASLERARCGIMHVPRRPYGFRDDAITIKAAEAAVIREAAARLLRGESLRSICMDFNRRAIPTADKALWQSPVLRRLLANPRLAGLSTYHHEVVGKGTWKPIISRRQSERIRTMLSDPRRRTGDGTHGFYLLTGVLRCGRCGEPMRAAPHRTRAYGCSRDTGQKGCGRVSIHMEALDAAFVARLYERLDSQALPAALKRGQLSDAKWRKARSALAAAEARLISMARDYATGSLTRSEWRAARPALIERVNASRAALEKDRAESVVAEFVGHADQLRDAWDHVASSRRRSIAAALVEEVVVWPATTTRSRADERILIWWRDEARPRTPRGARRGIAERRAAGAFDGCSVTPCPEPHDANGYCTRHLQRFRAHGNAGIAGRQRAAPYRGALCAVESCNGRATSLGRCNQHYREWRRNDPIRPRCSVSDCDRPAVARALCPRHYIRMRRTALTQLRARSRDRRKV
jgi:site-specific DNA recombinase